MARPSAAPGHQHRGGEHRNATPDHAHDSALRSRQQPHVNRNYRLRAPPHRSNRAGRGDWGGRTRTVDSEEAVTVLAVWAARRANKPYSQLMNHRGEFQVGQRIRTSVEPHVTGQIVDDYGSLAGTEVVVDDATTVRGRRWAVRLDDGQLLFADDDGIEPSIGS